MTRRAAGLSAKRLRLNIFTAARVRRIARGERSERGTESRNLRSACALGTTKLNRFASLHRRRVAARYFMLSRRGTRTVEIGFELDKTSARGGATAKSKTT